MFKFFNAFFINPLTFRGFSILVLFAFTACENPDFKPLVFGVAKESEESVEKIWESNEFKEVQSGQFNPGIQLNQWWIKTKLSNPGKEAGRFYFFLNNPHINRIEVYQDGSLQPKWLTGDRFPFDSRPYSGRDFIFPFDLAAGESVNLLLLLDKRGETFHIEPEFLSEADYTTRRRDENLIMGAVSGWMLLTIVLSLFLGFEIWQRSAFYYSSYILFVFLWIFSHWGMSYYLLWPEAINWVGKSRPVFNLAANLAFLLMIISFFPPSSSQKRIGQVFQVLIGLNTLILIAYLLVPESYATPQSIAISLKTILVISAIQIIVLFGYIISLYVAKVRFSGYYLAGVSFLYSFSLFVYLDQGYGIFHLPHYLLNFGSAFGIMGETTLIAFAFFRQASYEKKEKEILAVQILTKEKEEADRIITVLDEERARLGRDLHDGIGGMLNTLYLSVQQLNSKPDSDDIEKFKLLLNQTIDETRTLSHNLTPPLLEELGLINALENQFEFLSSKGATRIKFYHKLTQSLPKTELTMIYRIIVELISNALKHAEATEIFIQLISDQELLRLMVEDDGKGFSEKLNRDGIGIRNIKDRINYLNGKLTIDSSVNGTITIIEIPINP